MKNTIHEPLRRLAVPISSLKPDPANPRKHSEKNLAAIKASLTKFGQRKPIVVQKAGMIVRAGNGTMMAAKALGWTEIAAVIIDDDDATARQFAVADNRAAELAEWDQDILTLERAEFPDLDVLFDDPLDDLEDEEEKPEPWSSQPVTGVWLLAVTTDEALAERAIEWLEQQGLKVSRSAHRQQ
ncbi:MAG: ParB/Srx family N-terminal domain-containing protein [Planctomycetota bacterium]